MSFNMFVLTIREDVDDSFERAIVEKLTAEQQAKGPGK